MRDELQDESISRLAEGDLFQSTAGALSIESIDRMALACPPGRTRLQIPIPMRILDRYVLKSFLKNYFISLMVLVGMYIVLDMVFNFGDLVDIKSDGEATALPRCLRPSRDIADYYSYQFFLIFEHLSGIIPVVAAAFTLLRLSRFNELTAVLAAGVPLLRVAVPIILAGVAVNVLMVADQELLIPQHDPEADALARRDAPEGGRHVRDPGDAGQRQVAAVLRPLHAAHGKSGPATMEYPGRHRAAGAGDRAGRRQAAPHG